MTNIGIDARASARGSGKESGTCMTHRFFIHIDGGVDECDMTEGARLIGSWNVSSIDPTDVIVVLRHIGMLQQLEQKSLVAAAGPNDHGAIE